jgi:hypothetical protein
MATTSRFWRALVWSHGCNLEPLTRPIRGGCRCREIARTSHPSSRTSPPRDKVVRSRGCREWQNLWGTARSHERANLFCESRTSRPTLCSAKLCVRPLRSKPPLFLSLGVWVLPPCRAIGLVSVRKPAPASLSRPTSAVSNFVQTVDADGSMIALNSHGFL